jgi:hypothetical protein
MWHTSLHLILYCQQGSGPKDSAAFLAAPHWLGRTPSRYVHQFRNYHRSKPGPITSVHRVSVKMVLVVTPIDFNPHNQPPTRHKVFTGMKLLWLCRPTRLCLLARLAMR